MADRYRRCRGEGKTSLSHTHYNSHTSSNNPSFSSMLLDAIYRSIDIQAEEEMNICREMAEDANMRAASFKSDEEISNNYQRACMIEKWMENKFTEKIADRRKSAVDDLYVKKPGKDRQKSRSISSDSSCRGGGFFSSSSSSSSEGESQVQIRGSEKFGKKCNTSSQLVQQSTGSLSKKYKIPNSSNQFIRQSLSSLRKYFNALDFSSRFVHQSTHHVLDFSSQSPYQSNSLIKNCEISSFSTRFVHHSTNASLSDVSNLSSLFDHQSAGPLSPLVKNMSATDHSKIHGGLLMSSKYNKNTIYYKAEDIHPNNRYEMGSYKNDRDRKDFNDQLEQKSRALKINSDLKKVKKPISPGRKLTAFLNSLFTTGNLKGPKLRGRGDSPTTNPSMCSSSSTFSISCLTKTWSGRKSSGRSKRSVNFSPVSVIVEDDSPKSLHHENNNINIIKTAIDDELIMNYQKKNDDLRKTLVEFDHRDYDEEDDTEFDAASCASSDLFELDNILGIRMDDERYVEELPVYVLHNKNRATANFA